MHYFIGGVIGAILGGILSYLFRADESSLIEQGKQLAYEEIQKAKAIGRKL